jgi:signal transduction histidine kinase
MKAPRIPLRVPVSGAFWRYSVALVCTLVALLLRTLVAPLFGVHVPYHTVWGAIAIAAWLCGLGPAILATVVGIAGIWLWSPLMPRSYTQENGAAGIVSYLLLSGVMIAFGERSRRIAARRDAAERQARTNQILFETFMDNSPGNAYMKDGEGRYVYVNRTLRNRLHLAHPEGKTDFDLFPKEAAAAYCANDAEVLRDGKPREFVEYSDETDGRHAWLSIKFPVTDPDGNVLLCGKSFDVTDRVRAEDGLREAHRKLESRVAERTAELQAANTSLRQLSARLLQVRDQEHRKIARELHDSVGQILAALSINMSILQRAADQLPGQAVGAVTESAALLDQAAREIRTISHLLHPPLLDEVGLASALRWYVDGFAERSGIKVELHIATGTQRFAPDVEVALFRLVQECLTNIHRHSRSETARISLHPKDEWVCLEIADNGKGIPEQKRAAVESGGQLGVGLRGMRERIRLLEGILEIESGSTGTLVRATIPASDHAVVEADPNGKQQSPCAAA